MKNFYKTLPKPFFALAPMEHVTDTAFRQIVASVGRPDVFYTEFTSVEGICSEGVEEVAQRLKFTESERPIVAQIWGTHPEMFFKTAKKVAEMGFDGIDINMGCPEKHVIKAGACSALIKNHQLTSELIQATKEGAPNLPLSVKSRIGFSTIQTEEWIGFLLEQNLAALTVHLRTVKELSAVPAHWDEMEKVIKLRDAINPETVISGNGDVLSREQGKQYHNQYNVDGIMIGRGIFQNVYLFNDGLDFSTISAEERLKLLIKHAELFLETWETKKHFAIIKKFSKAYCRGFDGASQVRDELMHTNNIVEMKEVIRKHFAKEEALTPTNA